MTFTPDETAHPHGRPPASRPHPAADRPARTGGAAHAAEGAA
ncbi:hypothetical protein ABZ234_11215 [Nocardiopsis sp. NPDC006198]